VLVVDDRNPLKIPLVPRIGHETVSFQQGRRADISGIGPVGRAGGRANAPQNEFRCRHLPVLKKGIRQGIVLVGDLAKQISRDKKALISHLTDFITGKYPG
jgi:hypothetical protein